MLTPFFTLAAVSPGRQRTFRCLAAAHVVALGCGFAAVEAGGTGGAPLLGHLLLVAGIIEGALLIGWRLTQLPKSQALEFLLVSPVRPRQLFLAEALVGLARLALVNLAGLPLLLLLVGAGHLNELDVPLLLVMPLTWGALAGLALIAWAYEPVAVRRWGERLLLGLVLVYLVVGVLAGEHLREWLAWLPGDLGESAWGWFYTVHRYSPFAVMQAALRSEPLFTLDDLLTLQLFALAAIGVLGWRAACRLQGHFHDRHYRPAVDRSGRRRAPVGERPLGWWAVKRVSEYSGRVNLWLAGGFGIVYAAYTIAGPAWPAWMGRQVFEVFDGLGGIPVVATALVILAAVPAAYQYGLWDSSSQDRCRRLELLRLTRLGPADYWNAAAAAAWRRGRGYFLVAAGLWVAALGAGRVEAGQALTALAAGVILWGLYFVLGFRAFSRGVQANALGLLLTLGLPALAWGLYRAGWPALAALVPPGSVYQPAVAGNSSAWLPGPLLAATLALVAARFALVRCDAELRLWYDRHHGQKVID
ncbi:MAG: hypothetical protein IT429_11235 [Gemmataceae bacterium]|nr:hypothetical protein [Gemmataceae bacterium]